MVDKLANANTQTLKEVNKSLVLSTIHNYGPISRTEIAKISNLSVATVANLVTELLKEKVVIENGYQKSRGGRRSGILEINSDNSFLVGVELGETEITTFLANSKLEEKAFKKISLDESENKPENIISAIIASIRSVISEFDVLPEKVLGIGIGAPGLVDRGRGISIFAPNWGWHDVHMKEKIEQTLGIPTYVDNGAKVMALGEKWAGAAQGTNNVIVLIIGTGLGAGIIVNGKMCRGASESAGEWGHMVININGPKCSCGNKGCLEAYAGVSAIAKRTKEIILTTKDDSILKPLKNMQAGKIVHKVIKAARQNDPIAIQILKETGQYLGIGIANLVNLFNPEVVIIGGWVGIEAGEILLPIIRSTIQEHALEFPFGFTKIVISQLADKAIVLGAAAMVLRKFLQPPKIKGMVSV